jgi:hypothetical protein
VSPLKKPVTASGNAGQTYAFANTGNEEGALLVELLPFHSPTGYVGYDPEDPPFADGWSPALACNGPSTKTNITV